MGKNKKQHSKDQLYLTPTEWAEYFGGKKRKEKDHFRRLPIDHCCLSLQPFEHPYCTREGHVFDLVHIVPFLKKYGVNPVTGVPLSAKNLIKLTFHRNHEGKIHCPVTFKVFNEHSYIITIATTGNVFSKGAVDELNLKANNFRDLLTDDPFKKTDIITLQDPTDLSKFDMSNFYYLKNDMKPKPDNKDKGTSEVRSGVVTHLMKEALTELKGHKPVEWLRNKKVVEIKPTEQNAATYSSGKLAAAFTCNMIEPRTHQVAGTLDLQTVRYARMKKKAYVQLITNQGNLNLELHSEFVPKTCENFILLCERNYYDDVKFHRSIRNFVLQGGDPKGTGKGGESAWGKPFEDEIRQHLSHTGRGVLSMANSGPNTNNSQFFITYRSCKHLDGKHTIFGRLVGGLDVLDKIEHIETDEKDRPTEDVIIWKTKIFVNPFTEVDEQLEAERAPLEDAVQTVPEVKTLPELTVHRTGVGKFIKRVKDREDTAPLVRKKKAKLGLTDADFSNFG